MNTIDLLGDSVVATSIIEGTIVEFRDNVLTKVVAYVFLDCKNLIHVNLPSVTSIGTESFKDCSSLEVLILSSESICTLSNSNSFSNTPIAKGTGYIYVPRALLSDEDAAKDYRRATNWSTYANQFRALEDYTVDGTVTGELDESKI